VAKQAEEPLFFADFLRDPVLDPDTGEPLEVQPKYYESFSGGLPAIRCLSDGFLFFKVLRTVRGATPDYADMLHTSLGPVDSLRLAAQKCCYKRNVSTRFSEYPIESIISPVTWYLPDSRPQASDMLSFIPSNLDMCRLQLQIHPKNVEVF